MSLTKNDLKAIEELLDKKMDKKFTENNKKIESKIEESKLDILQFMFKHFPTKLEVSQMIDDKLAPVKSDLLELKDMFAGFKFNYEHDYTIMDLNVTRNTTEIRKIKTHLNLK